MDTTPSAQSEVEVLELVGDTAWRTRRCGIRELCKPSESTSGVVAIFLSSTGLAIPDNTQFLCNTFQIPESFFNPLLSEASGFFGATDDRHDPSDTDSDDAVHCRTWFRFRIKFPEDKRANKDGQSLDYRWDSPAFFTRWRSSAASSLSLVMCFDLPPSTRDAIQQSLRRTSAKVLLGSPFRIHVVILEQITQLFGTSVWDWRDYVREFEQSRPDLADPKPRYVLMHELARHVIHCTEMLATTINVVEAIIEESTLVFANEPTTRKDLEISRALRHQKTLLQHLHIRSQTLEERLRNEINLAFHINAQHDSLVAARIAEVSQIDGAATKTISVLGLVFLPATFISAVFSTSFFNFTPATDGTPQQWRVSESFWVYWAVAIPLTAVTILFWYFWPPIMRIEQREEATSRGKGVRLSLRSMVIGEKRLAKL